MSLIAGLAIAALIFVILDILSYLGVIRGMPSWTWGLCLAIIAVLMHAKGLGNL